MRQVYSFKPITIDINLLPRRASNRPVPVLGIVLILLVMLLSAAFGWFWYDAKEQLNDKRQQLTEVTGQISALETGLQQNAFNVQLSDVLKQPTALRASKPLVTELLGQINKLLPRYANVVQMEMNDRSAINLTMNFSTTEDIISFSRSVQDSASFKLLKMGTINNVPNALIAPSGELQPVESASSDSLPVYQTVFELQFLMSGEEVTKP